jgi:hypothetical protein
VLLPAGEVAIIWVVVLFVMVAELLPNLTAVAPLKSVPVMVTLVPPPNKPLLGEIPVTAGLVTVTEVVAIILLAVTCIALL